MRMPEQDCSTLGAGTPGTSVRASSGGSNDTQDIALVLYMHVACKHSNDANEISAVILAQSFRIRVDPCHHGQSQQRCPGFRVTPLPVLGSTGAENAWICCVILLIDSS
jgi:hypothetical protein